MDTTSKATVANKLRGKIKHVVDAPPYQIVTIELDPHSTPEITVAYIPVPGGPTLVASTDPAGPHILAATTGGAGSGGSSGSNDVTVTIPVPTGVISPIN